eukprot:TRINITY_DN1597_c0_g1_i1.p1 TRINITY_DN1597_c0_g1~~TRINITY_DN1597_c0_g1_i1.p1  ORF type:complete len:162 (-),score=40.98 TRINITY_DN1597_c0_g1_i1:317-802(-)
MLAAMFSGKFAAERDENGAYFIDRDPTHFRHILNYLRDGVHYLKECHILDEPIPHINELLREARYYNIRPLVNFLEIHKRRKKQSTISELTHEKEYKFLTSIPEDRLVETFMKMTAHDGYDFEAFMCPGQKKGGNSYHLLFSKKLSRGELMLLDKLVGMRG